MLSFSIYYEKNNEVIAENRFRTVMASPGAWPSWIDARRQYILLVIIIIIIIIIIITAAVAVVDYRATRRTQNLRYPHPFSEKSPLSLLILMSIHI